MAWQEEAEGQVRVTSSPHHCGQRRRRRRRKKRRTLQHVDVIELQALQAELDRVKDVLPALAILVHVAGVVGGLGTPQTLSRFTADGEMELSVVA